MAPTDSDDHAAPGSGTADRPASPALEHAMAQGQRFARMLQRDARVLAVFLEGSLAEGTADAYSDIDCVVVTEHCEPVASLCRGYLMQCGGLLSWRRSQGHGPELAFSGITADWMRWDVTLLTPQEVRSRRRGSLHVLWDRARIAESLPVEADLGRGHADIEQLVDEFLRGLGLLPVIVGRGEYRLGVSSAERLRALLAALLLEIDGVPGRGAELRLDPFLSEASHDVLDTIPIAASARESVIVAHLACARAFLPRARALATERDIPWPGQFEAATLRVLSDELDIDLPPSG